MGRPARRRLIHNTTPTGSGASRSLWASLFLAACLLAGSRWRVEVIDDAAYLGEFNSLALDHAGTPHVSYLDYENSQLKYARRMDSGWVIEVVDESRWWGGFTSIAIDAAGRPCITYTGPGNEARYATRRDGTWHIQPIEENVWYTSLTLGADDSPSVAYYAWDVRGLTVAQWTGERWQETVVDRVPDVGLYTSLVLDTSGRAHVSYVDRVGGWLKVAQRSGRQWEVHTLDAIGPDGGFTDIALRRNGAPVIAYYAGSQQDLRLAAWTPAI